MTVSRPSLLTCTNRCTPRRSLSSGPGSRGEEELDDVAFRVPIRTDASEIKGSPKTWRWHASVRPTEGCSSQARQSKEKKDGRPARLH